MNDQWIFQPYIGVGPVKFGMTVKDIKNILGSPEKLLVPQKMFQAPKESMITFIFK